MKKNSSLKDYTAADYQHWINLYVEKDLSIRGISRLTGVSKYLISLVIKQYTVLRSKSEAQKVRIRRPNPKTKYSQTEIDCWIDLYVNQNLAIRQIASRRKIPFISVYKRLAKAGVTRSVLQGQRLRRVKFPAQSRASIFRGRAGLYTPRENDPDTLYLILLDYKGLEIFKIGRTFDSRMTKRFPKTTEVSTPTLRKIYKTWHRPHAEIFRVEQLCLKKFKRYRFNHKLFPGSSECFKLQLPLQEVIDFVNTIISSQACSTELEGSETTGEV